MALKSFSTWLYKFSTGWLALIAVIIFILFTALVLPGQSAQAEDVSGDSGSPDMSFFYSAEKLFKMAEAYGDQGRSAYIRARFTFDLIWPLVYGFFLTTSISWSIHRSGFSKTAWGIINLVPVFGVIFDYLENITTSWVMFRFPQPAYLPATLAPFFTATKWIFVGGSFGILIIGILTAIWDTIQSKREQG
jgi:hypothetical protein